MTTTQNVAHPSEQDENHALHAQTDEEFRSRLRAFFASAGPGPRPRDAKERVAWSRAWQAELYDRGYAGPSFPRNVGGMDLTFSRQVIYQEEIARAKVPGPLGTGLGIVAPTIVTYGTEEQRQTWVRAMLRADEIWCQGFSEPGAGSDLQSLRTIARREGSGDDEVYVVNGQKVWTSSGPLADKLFCLVRTGTQESRQKGITYLVIDAHSPGVTIRPLKDLALGSHFAEVFLDDVRVPVENRIGEENEGWPLVRTSLGHERAAGAMNQAARYRQVLSELVALARERGLTADPLVRDRLADFEIRVRLMRFNAESIIENILARGEPGPTSSVSRLLLTSFEQDLHEFAVEMLGPDGLITKPSDQAIQRARWLTGFLTSRAATIGAGTAEIQRNTVAEQVLKLPYDPAMPPR
jgi:alkylation response protein AidB-like acyl-CoA dehydrogenase